MKKNMYIESLKEEGLQIVDENGFDADDAATNDAAYWNAIQNIENEPLPESVTDNEDAWEWKMYQDERIREIEKLYYEKNWATLTL